MIDKFDTPEQYRINRINKLLDRLDKIPGELDKVYEQLHNPGGYTRDQYAALADKRLALIYEQDRVENELKLVYRMKI